GVGDHGGRHRTPRIDMKISRRTEQAFIGGDDDRVMHAVRRPCDSSNIDTCRCDNRSAGMLQRMRSVAPAFGHLEGDALLTRQQAVLLSLGCPSRSPAISRNSPMVSYSRHDVSSPAEA